MFDVLNSRARCLFTSLIRKNHSEIFVQRSLDRINHTNTRGNGLCLWQNRILRNANMNKCNVNSNVIMNDKNWFRQPVLNLQHDSANREMPLISYIVGMLVHWGGCLAHRNRKSIKLLWLFVLTALRAVRNSYEFYIHFYGRNFIYTKIKNRTIRRRTFYAATNPFLSFLFDFQSSMIRVSFIMCTLWIRVWWMVAAVEAALAHLRQWLHNCTVYNTCIHLFKLWMHVTTFFW